MHGIFADYLLRQEYAGLDEATIVANTRALAYADRWLESNSLDPLAVPPQEFERYFHLLRKDGAGVATKGLAPGTVANMLVSVRAAYRYAIRLGKLTEDPTRTVPGIRLDRDEPKTFTNNELRRIWAACITPNEVLLFALLAFSGMRRMEACKLLWEQIDLDGNTINVYGRGNRSGGAIGKMGKPRQIPLHPELRVVLMTADRSGRYVLKSQKGSCYSGGGLRDLLDALLGRAGVTGSFKTFRATFNSSLMENDAIERYAEEIMGHTPRTVNRVHYQRHAPQKLYETICLVYRDDPILQAPRAALEAV